MSATRRAMRSRELKLKPQADLARQRRVVAPRCVEIRQADLNRASISHGASNRVPDVSCLHLSSMCANTGRSAVSSAESSAGSLSKLARAGQLSIISDHCAGDERTFSPRASAVIAGSVDAGRRMKPLTGVARASALNSRCRTAGARLQPRCFSRVKLASSHELCECARSAIDLNSTAVKSRLLYSRSKPRRV